MFIIQRLLRLIHPLYFRIKCHSVLNRLGWKPGKLVPASLGAAPAAMVALKEGDAIHKHLLATGVYDLELTQVIARLACKEGGLMIDAGANVAYFSTIWASLSPQNCSVAFEPSPANIEMIRKNLAHNDLTERVQLIPKALGRASGEITFELGPDEETGWGMIAKDGAPRSIRVPITTIDETLPRDAQVTVMKIDCQGADSWVIEGARKMFEEKRVKHVFYEVCPPLLQKLNIDPEYLPRLLSGWGYIVEPFCGSPFQSHAYLK
jgi:FkbM family methyltransferase